MKSRLVIVLALAACSSSPDQAEAPQLADPLEVSQAVEIVAPAIPEQPFVTSMRDRVDEYERVTREARTRGALSGVLRGTLLGAVIAGEQGAVIGAFVGGVVGSAIAESVAADLIIEHQGYLLQRHSIEAVILAAQADSAAIETDVGLVREYSSGLASRGAFSGENGLPEVLAYSRGADLAVLVSVAEERTRNLLIVTEALAAQGEDVALLRAEQERQNVLHAELRRLLSDFPSVEGVMR